MTRVMRLDRLIALIVILLWCFVLASTAQEKSKRAQVEGTPVMWESVNISGRNLLLGPGGKEMKPDLRNITFIKDEKGGYSKKYRIKDGSGCVWIAKISKEAQPETVAVRLIWALGYKTEINYLAPTLTIPGKGTFANVRLEARPENVKRLDEWRWKENPFVNTNEYKGLIVMMAFLNNWDLKDSNNRILVVNNNGEVQLHYIISDLGATLGKTGGFFTRSRNKPEDYQEAKFIKTVKNNYIDFNYGGKMQNLFENITVEQASWVANLLSQLSDNQIRDAFSAANYSTDEVNMLAQSVKDRIAELNRVTSQNRIGSKSNE